MIGGLCLLVFREALLQLEFAFNSFESDLLIEDPLGRESLQKSLCQRVSLHFSNHRSHRAYLKRFNLTNEENCRLGKTHSTEKIEHLMRDCAVTAEWLPEDQEIGSAAIERIVCELRRCERRELEEAGSNERENLSICLTI